MWFTETPWPPILGLCVVGVLLFLAGMSQQRKVFLLGVVVCVALCGIVFVAERQIVTERERVEQNLLDFAAAFQRESMQQGVVNLLIQGPEPESLKYISASAAGARRLAVAALNFVDLPEPVRITDVRTTMSNQDSRAVTHFRASATVRAGGYTEGVHHPTRWELTWQREKGDWKILRASRLHFMSGEELHNPFTTRE
jgi:hypothetical protein